jgi:hypothetical protein
MLSIPGVETRLKPQAESYYPFGISQSLRDNGGSEAAAPRLVIPTVSRSSGKNDRSLIFYQNEGAFGRIIEQGCSTR